MIVATAGVGATAYDVPNVETTEYGVTRSGTSPRYGFDGSDGVSTDTLTGLANRRAWDRMLDAEEARCARHGAAACVISVDLDGLKAINDTAGHLAGDAALRLAADAIASASRDEDVVARVGGDEFGILAIECEQSAGDVIAARVVRSLREAGLSASLGVGSREPVRGLFGAWLAADAAMYRDKAGR